MTNSIRLLVLLFVSLFFAVGCEAGIGDKCGSSNDCPQGTICDTDSPDGYCLASGCESDEECPEDATCVAFTPDITYCLKRCKDSGNCRGGYTCRDDIGKTKFCYVPPDGVYGREPDHQINFEPPTSTNDSSNDQNPDDQNQNPGDQNPGEQNPNPGDQNPGEQNPNPGDQN